MSVVSMLIIMFAILFWIFRVVLAVTTSLNIDLGIEIPDMTAEVVILFIALFCLLLIARRKIIGAIIYLVSYGWYFGKDVVSTVINMINGVEVSTTQIFPTILGLLALILAFATFFDILLNNFIEKKGIKKDKKTDWFYKNEEFDRQFDERADRNNYKF